MQIQMWSLGEKDERAGGSHWGEKKIPKFSLGIPLKPFLTPEGLDTFPPLIYQGHFTPPSA